MKPRLSPNPPVFSLSSNDSRASKTLLLDYAETLIGQEPQKIGVVISKTYRKQSDCPFGYLREVQLTHLQQIKLLFLDDLSDIIGFLLAQTCSESIQKLAFVFILELEEYLGRSVIQAAPQLTILMQLMVDLNSRIEHITGADLGRIGYTYNLAEENQESRLKGLTVGLGGRHFSIQKHSRENGIDFEVKASDTAERVDRPYESHYVGKLLELVAEYELANQG